MSDPRIWSMEPLRDSSRDASTVASSARTEDATARSIGWEALDDPPEPYDVLEYPTQPRVEGMLSTLFVLLSDPP